METEKEMGRARWVAHHDADGEGEEGYPMKLWGSEKEGNAQEEERVWWKRWNWLRRIPRPVWMKLCVLLIKVIPFFSSPFFYSTYN
jgi:hypothetical protein